MTVEARKKPAACVVANGVLEPCSVLSGALEDSNMRSGIALIQSFDSSAKPRIRYQAVKICSSESPRAGWHINYCPFCGRDIRSEKSGTAVAEVG